MDNCEQTVAKYGEVVSKLWVSCGEVVGYCGNELWQIVVPQLATISGHGYGKLWRGFPTTTHSLPTTHPQMPTIIVVSCGRLWRSRNQRGLRLIPSTSGDQTKLKKCTQNSKVKVYQENFISKRTRLRVGRGNDKGTQRAAKGPSSKSWNDGMTHHAVATLL